MFYFLVVKEYENYPTYPNNNCEVKEVIEEDAKEGRGGWAGDNDMNPIQESVTLDAICSNYQKDQV